MAWLHYSAKPITRDALVSRDQEAPHELSSFSKPRGFWITDDSEHCWASWCRVQSFNLFSLERVHEVELDESRILFARDALDLDAFTERYGCLARSYPAIGSGPAIDWNRVASEFAGIIITPYVWSRRMELNWYYGWDCASGCIWDVSAVLGVREVEVFAKDAQ